MKLPTEIGRSQIQLDVVAEELSKKQGGDTPGKWRKWLDECQRDIYFFSRGEEGFGDWTEEDYARNTTKLGGSGEPYAFFLDKLVVVHDYV